MAMQSQVTMIKSQVQQANDLKRFLFLGPTGAGKSKMINCCLNRAVDEHMLKKPAAVSNDEQLIGTTATLSSYIDYKRRIAYVDTIGYGDVRFDKNQEAFALYFRELICYTSIGYHWVFLVLRYQQFTQDILIYIETLEKLLEQNVFTRCTVIFTHCKVKNMTLEKCLEANKDHEKTVNILKKVHGVIFGNMTTDHDSDTDDDDDEEDKERARKKKHKKRTRFMEQILNIIDNTDNQLLKLDIHWFEYYWTKFSLFMAYCYEKLSGKQNKLSKLYQLSADLKRGANILIYYEECSICLKLITEIPDHEPTACKTICNHIFHYDCLQKWFQRQAYCPMCNTELHDVPKRTVGRELGLREVEQEQPRRCCDELIDIINKNRKDYAIWQVIDNNATSQSDTTAEIGKKSQQHELEKGTKLGTNIISTTWTQAAVSAKRSDSLMNLINSKAATSRPEEHHYRYL